MDKRLSIIIVTYNSEKHIFDCLKSIYDHNDIGDKLEVIIVDNCSNNFVSTKKRIKEKYKGVRIIDNEQNGGYGQGNNIGIKNSQAPIVMIMNPDVRIPSPYFDKVCRTFESDNELSMYGLKQKIEDNINGNSFFMSFVYNPYISIPLTKLCNKLDIYLSKYMYFSGACFFIRKSDFEKIGLFDEKLFMYKEEYDVHTRLINNNMKILYDKSIYYSHLHYLGKPKSDIVNIQPSITCLKNGIYLSKKYGRYTIARLIKNQIRECNIMLFKERLLKLLKKNNPAFEKYNIEWKKYLLNHYKEYTV